VQTVIRPVTKLTSAQQRLLDEAVAEARQADAKEESTWQKIKAARDAGVPDTLLCKETRRSRTTLNRKYGPRPD
jgi:hypothetical protein